MLRDLRDRADFLRPYDLLERALIDHGGRLALIARLGPEAEDAIAAMLDQALAYEAMEVPSLTGFVGWLEAGEVTVKRDLAKPNGQIRVMTVHGAKGLEAPVVFLPDTAIAHHGGGNRIDLITADDGPCLWPRADSATAALRAALAARVNSGNIVRTLVLDARAGEAIAWLHGKGKIEHQVEKAGTITLDASLTTQNWGQFDKLFGAWLLES